MVHVASVRSAHAHARLIRVGLVDARRAPGVAGVLAGDAVARLCKPYRGVLLHYQGMKTGAMLPLSVERVRYVGEPIVAIAAESRAAADDAAPLIDVEYGPLPAVLAPEAAVGAGAPLIHPDSATTSSTRRDWPRGRSSARHPARRRARRGPWEPGARSELHGDRARRT